MKRFVAGFLLGAVLASLTPAVLAQTGIGYAWKGRIRLDQKAVYCCLTAVVAGEEKPLINCLKVFKPQGEGNGRAPGESPAGPERR